LLSIYYVFSKKKKQPGINISSIEIFKRGPVTLRQRLLNTPFILRMIALFFLIIALARPQSNLSRQDVEVEGIDIMITMDISGSMLARDFKPNRLETAKKISTEFIRGRHNDRIGLVAFSGEAFLQCPLTIDHILLDTLLNALYSGMIEDGTAIGDGLGLSVYHLRKSLAISKVIILITDGVNNTGSMDPLTAADIASLYGIRAYTIGVGKMGMAPFPVQTPFGLQFMNMEVKIDEDLCTKIAEKTGGKYFRAQNENKLREIYKEIDKLEKSKINVSQYNRKKEHFLPFLVIGFSLLLLDSLLKYTIFRTLP
jgi:Ca-activated chloride channel family protein